MSSNYTKDLAVKLYRYCAPPNTKHNQHLNRHCHIYLYTQVIVSYLSIYTITQQDSPLENTLSRIYLKQTVRRWKLLIAFDTGIQLPGQSLNCPLYADGEVLTAESQEESDTRI